MCGCTKTASTNQWVYVAPEGDLLEYPSEIEARAARVRNGGQGVVRPK